jgi:nucleotide-binding universal stress UspA family protein
MEKLLCPTKLEKLLACTDGSPDSEEAVKAALALANACNSKVYLMEVIEELPLDPELFPLQEAVVQRERQALEYLDSWKVEAHKLGVSLETRVVLSETPFTGIIGAAQEIQPDLIVMGRHGGSRLYRLFMGNVTARVIIHSPFNVLVVPKDVSLDFKEIMIASDGSPASYAAWEEAVKFAQRLGSRLIAISVAVSEQEMPVAQGLIDKLKSDAARAGLKLEALVRSGRPYEAILQAATERKVDLLVMGALGLSGLKAFLLGSVTERVIAGAPCAVLVVKEAFH